MSGFSPDTKLRRFFFANTSKTHSLRFHLRMDKRIEVTLKPKKRVKRTLYKSIPTPAYLVSISKWCDSRFTIFKVDYKERLGACKLLAYSEIEPDYKAEFLWLDSQREFVQVEPGTRKRLNNNEKVRWFSWRKEIEDRIYMAKNICDDEIPYFRSRE